nr:PTS sugar transporter subunit IIC [Sebaldella sp.]
TVGWYVLGRPFVSGAIIGLILGDVQAGIIIGAAVQIVFIAMITPGGAMPTDLNVAAYIGVGLGLISYKSGASVESAVAIATAVGAVGVVFHNFQMIVNTLWNQRSVKYIETADYKQLLLNHSVYPQITLFLFRALPTFVILYYGQGYASEILRVFPADSYIMRTLTTLGGMLPAIGVAILINAITKKNIDILPVLLGFTLVVTLGINMLSLAIIAAFFAYSQFHNDKGQTLQTEEAGVKAELDDMEEEL